MAKEPAHQEHKAPAGALRVPTGAGEEGATSPKIAEHQAEAPKPKASLGGIKNVISTTVGAVKAYVTSRRLPVARMVLAGYLHNNWDVTTERGTTVEDLLCPEYWAHVAANLRPHDQIHAISEDGSWYARLIVINADRLWAKLHVLEKHDLSASREDMPQAQEEAYEVVWLSAMAKYAVIRRADRAALKEGFQTKLEAFQWLDGYLKTLNN